MLFIITVYLINLIVKTQIFKKNKITFNCI